MGIKTTASRLEWALKKKVGADQERMYWNSCVMCFIETVRRRGGVRERRKILGKEEEEVTLCT